jgi:TatD DNase family protein
MFAGEYRGSKSHDPDLPAVLDRAWAAGVHKIVITAGSVDEARDALELAKTDGECMDRAIERPFGSG